MLLTQTSAPPSTSPNQLAMATIPNPHPIALAADTAHLIHHRRRDVAGAGWASRLCGIRWNLMAGADPTNSEPVWSGTNVSTVPAIIDRWFPPRR
jgi:hypothetical protein